MAEKSKPQELDIDQILLRDLASRRAPSGSVLGMTPEQIEQSRQRTVTLPELVVSADGDSEPMSVPGTKPRAEARSQYEQLFLRENIVHRRSVIYIDEQTKGQLTDIAYSLTRGRISVTTLADNILAHHIELFRDQINRLHRRKNNKELL